MPRFNVSLDQDDFDRMEAARMRPLRNRRMPQPRSTFVREAIREYLAKGKQSKQTTKSGGR